MNNVDCVSSYGEEFKKKTPSNQTEYIKCKQYLVDQIFFAHLSGNKCHKLDQTTVPTLFNGSYFQVSVFRITVSGSVLSFKLGRFDMKVKQSYTDPHLLGGIYSAPTFSRFARSQVEMLYVFCFS